MIAYIPNYNSKLTGYTSLPYREKIVSQPLSNLKSKCMIIKGIEPEDSLYHGPKLTEKLDWELFGGLAGYVHGYFTDLTDNRSVEITKIEFSYLLTR